MHNILILQQRRRWACMSLFIYLFFHLKPTPDSICPYSSISVGLYRSPFTAHWEFTNNWQIWPKYNFQLKTLILKLDIGNLLFAASVAHARSQDPRFGSYQTREFSSLETRSEWIIWIIEWFIPIRKWIIWCDLRTGLPGSLKIICLFMNWTLLLRLGALHDFFIAL